MKKVIVTGASGFIGQALVKELNLQGYHVTAIIRNESKKKIFNELKNILIYISDMATLETILSIIPKDEFEAFYHLAWDGSSGDSREDYKKQLLNVEYSCLAVEVAQKLGCKQFIYAGSLMELESSSYIPLNGSKPSRNYVYRTAKLAAHYMAKSIAVSVGIDFKMGMISNAYGVGEKSPRLINTTIKKLLNGEKTSFTKGEQLYDFIYITDVVEAFIKIMEEGKPYNNYYIGNKVQRPLREYLIRLKNCINSEIDLGLGEIYFDGVCIDYSKIDTNSLYKDTSFNMKVGFSEGINKTITWIKESGL